MSSLPKELASDIGKTEYRLLHLLQDARSWCDDVDIFTVSLEAVCGEPFDNKSAAAACAAMHKEMLALQCAAHETEEIAQSVACLERLADPLYGVGLSRSACEECNDERAEQIRRELHDQTSSHPANTASSVFLVALPINAGCCEVHLGGASLPKGQSDHVTRGDVRFRFCSALRYSLIHIHVLLVRRAMALQRAVQQNLEIIRKGLSVLYSRLLKSRMLEMNMGEPEEVKQEVCSHHRCQQWRRAEEDLAGLLKAMHNVFALLAAQCAELNAAVEEQHNARQRLMTTLNSIREEASAPSSSSSISVALHSLLRRLDAEEASDGESAAPHQCEHPRHVHFDNSTPGLFDSNVVTSPTLSFTLPPLPALPALPVSDTTRKECEEAVKQRIAGRHTRSPPQVSDDVVALPAQVSERRMATAIFSRIKKRLRCWGGAREGSQCPGRECSPRRRRYRAENRLGVRDRSATASVAQRPAMAVPKDAEHRTSTGEKGIVASPCGDHTVNAYAPLRLVPNRTAEAERASRGRGIASAASAFITAVAHRVLDFSDEEEDIDVK